MRQRFLSNPMLLEVATYFAVVVVAAGLALTHWAGPLTAGAQSAVNLVP